MKTFNEWLTEMGMDINVDKKPLSRLHRKPSDDVPPEDDMGDDEDGEEGDDDILERGEYFASVLDVRFNFIKLK